MSVDLYEDLRGSRETVAGEGLAFAVPTLLGLGLRQPPLGGHSGEAADADSRRDHGTSEGMPASLRGRAGLSNRLPESVKSRWMSFGGTPAAQVPQDYLLWEVLLNEHPHLRGIVELGTWKGGFSDYLYCQAEKRGLFFRTYDVASPGRTVPGFVQLDIFAEADAIGGHLHRHDPVILLCDGGNKPRELKTFSRYLSPQSVIVVHDWNQEIVASDVPENVQMVYGEFCEEIESMSRCFQVIP